MESFGSPSEGSGSPPNGPGARAESRVRQGIRASGQAERSWECSRSTRSNRLNCRRRRGPPWAPRDRAPRVQPVSTQRSRMVRLKNGVPVSPCRRQGPEELGCSSGEAPMMPSAPVSRVRPTAYSPPSVVPAWQAHRQCVHRSLRRSLPGRMPQRPLVPAPCGRPQEKVENTPNCLYC
jgi:hypothetical protein